MRSNTKERYFAYYNDNKVPKHASGKAGQLKTNNRTTNKVTECPECQSMNCKQRRFDIKCYECGVVIEDE